MGWTRLRCSGTLTRKNKTVNTAILINSQSRTKYYGHHGTTRQSNRRIQIGDGIWETEVRHLEDSTHKVQDFYGYEIRKFHSVVRYLNNQPTGNIAFFTVTKSGNVSVWGI